MIFFIITGLVSGIISGMGIGGGTILIPVLTIFAGIEQQTAQCINLIYFIPTAVVSLWLHVKNGNVEKKDLLSLIISGVIFAGIGSFLMYYIDAMWLRKMFGGLLFIMGLTEIFKKDKQKR